MAKRLLTSCTVMPTRHGCCGRLAACLLSRILLSTVDSAMSCALTPDMTCSAYLRLFLSSSTEPSAGPVTSTLTCGASPPPAPGMLSRVTRAGPPPAVLSRVFLAACCRNDGTAGTLRETTGTCGRASSSPPYTVTLEHRDRTLTSYLT